MNTQNAKELIALGFGQPGQAMQQALQLGLAPRTIWMIVLLITVIASLVTSLALYFIPKDDPLLRALAHDMLAYQAPAMYCAAQFAQAVLAIYAIAIIGKSLEGRGAPHHIALGFVIIQVVALLLAFVIALLIMLVPAVDMIGILAIAIWGIWASVMVVNVAHGFDDKLKSFFVLFLAGVVTMAAKTVVMSVLGISPLKGI